MRPGKLRGVRPPDLPPAGGLPSRRDDDGRRTVEQLLAEFWRVRGEVVRDVEPFDLDCNTEDVAGIDSSIRALLAGGLDEAEAQRVCGRILLFRVWRQRCEVALLLGAG